MIWAMQAQADQNIHLISGKGRQVQRGMNVWGYLIISAALARVSSCEAQAHPASLSDGWRTWESMRTEVRCKTCCPGWSIDISPPFSPPHPPVSRLMSPPGARA